MAQVRAHSCRCGSRSGIGPLIGVPTDTMASRRLRTRYPGTCAACSTAIAAGSTAWWDSDAKTLRCADCEAPESTESPPTLETGTAGGSAQREFERRHAKREERVRAAHPRVGGLLLAAFDDPHSTKAWSTGAEGERRVAATLDALAADGVVILHDRRIPRTKANIDHLVVAPSGVWVVDSKHYTGRVERRDVGSFFRPDERLFVGTRDCSKLLGGMVPQVEAVRAAVSYLEEPPVIPVLCFVDAEWGLFTKPFRLNEVLVIWPKALVKAIQATEQARHPLAVQELAGRLAAALPPA